MSNIGKPCERALWYELNGYEGEGLSASTYLKFLYGDLVEELVLFLAQLAGHTVTGRQDVSEIEGIKGHRDAVVDGVLVDVKSASQYSFKKFQTGLTAEVDSFGYIPQLQSYLWAAQDDDQVTEKDRAAFLVVDKTLGHLTMDTHSKDTVNWAEFYNKKKEVVSSPEVPPRGFEPVPEGKSGNMKLPTPCGYCAFKHSCHKDLRTFLYSTGPVYLTHVAREPQVQEIKE